MLSNAYFLAEVRFDTAENEPAKKMLIFLILLTLTQAERRSPPPTVTPRPLRPRDGRLLRGPGDHDGAGLCSSAGLIAVFGRVFGKFRQKVARFRLYRSRSLEVNMRFAAFSKIYQII